MLSDGLVWDDVDFGFITPSQIKLAARDRKITSLGHFRSHLTHPHIRLHQPNTLDLFTFATTSNHPNYAISSTA